MDYRGGEIVGIDPATNTGFTSGEPGATPVLDVIDFRVKKDDSPRLIFKRATFWWATRLQRPPAAVFIEAPVPPTKLIRKRTPTGGTELIEARTNFDVTKIAFGLYGIFVGLAECKGVPTYDANINAWRAVFFGKGNGRLKGDVAKKMAKRACQALDWDCKNDDNAAESAGIWTYGVYMLAKRNMPPLWKIKGLFERGTT